MSRTKKLTRLRRREAEKLAGWRAVYDRAMDYNRALNRDLSAARRDLQHAHTSLAAAIARIAKIQIGGSWYVPVIDDISESWTLAEAEQTGEASLLTTRVIDTDRQLIVSYNVRAEMLHEFLGADDEDRDYLLDQLKAVGGTLMRFAAEKVLRGEHTA